MINTVLKNSTTNNYHMWMPALVILIVLGGCSSSRQVASEPDSDSRKRAEQYTEQKLQDAREGKPDPNYESFLVIQTRLKVESGQYQTAVHTAEDLLQYYEIVHGPNAMHTGLALEWLGDIYYNLNRRDEGIALLERALAVYRQHGQEAIVDRIRTMNSLGSIFLLQGKPDRAEPILEESLAHSEAHFGVDSPEVGLVCSLLSKIYADQGKAAESSEMKKRSQRLLPPS